MDKIIERIIISNGSPTVESDMWLDISGEQPVLKYCDNGTWITVGGTQ